MFTGVDVAVEAVSKRGDASESALPCLMERFSKSQVVGAGKAIVGRHCQATPELASAFATAHAWRNGHLEPLRQVRRELAQKARQLGAGSITVGRLKRFQSIRRKLKTGRVTLYQMQDIGGVRAIVPTMAHVEALTAQYLAGKSSHEVCGSDDYIAAPKGDGYRSRHIVVKFADKTGLVAGNRIVIEIQIRTHLQHAWATAVEAVGFVRGENLKAGQGDRDWLRFFELVSAEFAAEEGQFVGRSSPKGAAERLRELREIADRIGAIVTLESYNQAIKSTEGYLGLKGHSYVVRYDVATHEVTVRRFAGFSRLSVRSSEEQIFDEAKNVIIVEIDKVDDLRSAYPNYFLDVRMFTDRLKQVVLQQPQTTNLKERPRGPLKWAPFLNFLRTHRTSQNAGPKDNGNR